MLRRLFGAVDAPAPCKYLGSVMSDSAATQLNRLQWPEIALVGRSNVGKSSLINALVKHPVARCSKTPGRTRRAHMFSLGDAAILVDLPGYSFAKGPREDLEEMSTCIAELSLLRDESALARVLMLCDARRGGLMHADWNMLAALADKGIGVDVVLTKVDRLSRTAASALVKDVGTRLSPYEATVVGTSCRDNVGIDGVRVLLAKAVERFASRCSSHLKK